MNYILFGSSISNIGGAEQYILRRAEYMAEKGNNVVFVSKETKPLLINGFVNFNIIEVQEIGIPIYFFSRRKVDYIVDSIYQSLKKHLINEQTIIIESASIYYGLWSELLAKKMGAVSLIYELTGCKIHKNYVAEFAAFKLAKKELLGCSEHLLSKMFTCFNEYYDSSKNIFINIPFNKNEISFEAKVYFNHIRNDNDIRILSVSRVAKPYLSELIKEISVVAAKMPDKKIILSLILDKREGLQLSRLKSIANSESRLTKNFTVEFMGPLVPLPYDLFRQSDIFVGAGTAALNAISCGVPTVLQNHDTNMSPGIFGVDIDYFGYAPQYSNPVSEVVLKLLNHQELMSEASSNGLNLYIDSYETTGVMKKFDLIIKLLESRKVNEYYCFPNIINLNLKEKIAKYIIYFLGHKFYLKLLQIWFIAKNINFV